jgi:hypothetical protein
MPILLSRGVAMRIRPNLLFVLLAVVGTCHSQAVINQGLAGSGIGGGDTPGFPVTITVPGSYYLSSNLRPPTGVDAIDITASNVTLDLNGFNIGGFQPCSQSTGNIAYWTCTPGMYGVGINSTGDQTVIANGNVFGFTTGVSLSGTGNRVTHLGLQTNATALKNTGFGDVLDTIRADRNGNGISLFGPQSKIQKSSAAFNGGYGLYAAGSGAVASNITATLNKGNGINFKLNAIGQSLVSAFNGSAGISAGGTTVLSNLVADSNYGDGVATSGRNTVRSAIAADSGSAGFRMSTNTCFYQIDSRNNVVAAIVGGTSFTTTTCF